MGLSALKKRLDALEERTKPRIISTLADYVLWAASDGDVEVEFSPEIQRIIEEANSESDGASD